MTYRLTVLPSGNAIEYKPGPNMLELLHQSGFLAESPCGGRGTCGKCRVRLVEGNLPKPGKNELSLLTDGELERGMRLACLVYPEGDLTLELTGNESGHQILTEGYLPDFTRRPAVRKSVHPIPKPTLHNQRSYEELVLEQTGASEVSLTVLQQLSLDSENYTAVQYNERLVAVETGDTTAKAYGLAIDIGTTTVVVALVDLNTGRELGVNSAINAQKEFGLDVLTRITYIQEQGKVGLQSLRQVVVNSLNEMVAKLCMEQGVEMDFIYDIAIAANNTMQHILLGINPSPLGRSPYAPVFQAARYVPARHIGLRVGRGSRAYFLPAVSAYIGADIVAGAHICGLEKQEENVLFIDIGTNGEIVLAHEGKLLCCSCAAGPALEGMNISSGMRASEGAVEDVRISAAGVWLKVIGDVPAAGLCGSGILAAVAQLLESGVIKSDGKLEKADKLPQSDYRQTLLAYADGKRAIELCTIPNRLLVTQKDVRQIQLAKGAILSGFYALLDQAGIAMEQLSRVLVAGQFGAHLPVESLVGCGILPAEVADRIEYVGNSSKTGAYVALLSTHARAEMETLARHMNYVELSAVEGYEKLFLRCLQFPEREVCDEKTI